MTKKQPRKTQPTRRPRYIVMSVPGRDEGDPASWFVYDTKHRTSEEQPSMQLADLRALALNREHEIH